MCKCSELPNIPNRMYTKSGVFVKPVGLFLVALRQQKQSSPLSVGSQQSLQDSGKPSHQSTEELPVTNPLHGSKMESML